MYVKLREDGGSFKGFYKIESLEVKENKGAYHLILNKEIEIMKTHVFFAIENFMKYLEMCSDLGWQWIDVIEGEGRIETDVDIPSLIHNRDWIDDHLIPAMGRRQRKIARFHRKFEENGENMGEWHYEKGH